LLIDVVKARINQGKPIKLQFTQKIDDSLICDYNARFLSEIEFCGEYYLDQFQDIKVQAKMFAKIEFLCALCGKPVIKDFIIDVDETFTQIANKENYTFSKNNIELNQLITDNIVLNMPTVVKCSENCLGRCPICGIDKNTTKCNCELLNSQNKEEDINPFSILKTLNK
jgi:uncharacterized protein